MAYPNQNPFMDFIQRIPPVTRNLLFGMVAVFLAQQVNEFFVIKNFALWPIGTPYFRPWQLITYAFVHANFTHLLFNGFAIWMFGTPLEQYWGSKRYATYVLACIIGAALLHLILTYVMTGGGIPIPTIGISGAVYGLLLAFGMMWPEQRILLLIPPVPIKAKYFVMIYALLVLWSSFSGYGSAGIAHFAHLGGMVTGFLLIQYWRGKPPFRFK